MTQFIESQVSDPVAEKVGVNRGSLLNEYARHAAVDLNHRPKACRDQPRDDPEPDVEHEGTAHGQTAHWDFGLFALISAHIATCNPGATQYWLRWSPPSTRTSTRTRSGCPLPSDAPVTRVANAHLWLPVEAYRPDDTNRVAATSTRPRTQP